jgi:hypothetical protein
MHKNKKNRIIPLFLIIIICLILISPSVFSDGGAYIRRPSIDSWITLDQEKQIGIINYDEGYEKLILVISVRNSSLEGDKAVWIFPVPSDPDNVNINIIENIPQLAGDSVKEIAHDSINDPFWLTYLSQPYLAPFVLLFIYVGGMLGGGSPSDYNIYESIQKSGLTTEKVGAKNSSAFQDYISSNDLFLYDDANSIIDEYIQEEYCFIVSWISDVEEFKNDTISNTYYHDYRSRYNPETGEYDPICSIGVSIDFPSEEIYYPLKLTSVYGKQRIPILLQIIDFVKPLKYPNFKNSGYMEIEYFRDDYWISDELVPFFSEQIEKKNIQFDWIDDVYKIDNLGYTEIKINSESEDFTDDFWLEDSKPGELYITEFVADFGIFILIFLYAIGSMFISLISALIVFRKQTPDLKKFSLLGLSNFGGLLGLIAASYSLNIDKNFVLIQKDKNFTSKISKTLFITILIEITIVVMIALLLILGLFMIMIYLISLPLIVFILILIYYIMRKKHEQKLIFCLIFSGLFSMFIFITNIIISQLFI